MGPLLPIGPALNNRLLDPYGRSRNWFVVDIIGLRLPLDLKFGIVEVYFAIWMLLFQNLTDPEQSLVKGDPRGLKSRSNGGSSGNNRETDILPLQDPSSMKAEIFAIVPLPLC
jgi:hypothetical protein